MPEPTGPTPDDNSNDQPSSGDIADSTYTRDRSARDEEVGRTPTPQELAELRDRMQGASGQSAPQPSRSESTGEEDPYVPPTSKEDTEIKKRNKLTRIRLSLPSKLDRNSGRTPEHDKIEDAIDAYINEEELSEEQQKIIDDLLSESKYSN